MDFHKQFYSIFILFSILITISINLHVAQATRPFGVALSEESLLLQSLPRGGVPQSSKASPCTYIPTKGSGKCTLNGINVAGDLFHPSPDAYPGVATNFVEATKTNNGENGDLKDSTI
ncbi:hypothetical protein LIER_32305 [Lithospermum erythrorhizon]|uniref:Uncharacterized protein n=1 Tax=Lithospermum erythrorhizon TaxID=34254 RepID=A0AAV3RUS2_LITER